MCLNVHFVSTKRRIIYKYLISKNTVEYALLFVYAIMFLGRDIRAIYRIVTHKGHRISADKSDRTSRTPMKKRGGSPLYVHEISPLSGRTIMKKLWKGGKQKKAVKTEYTKERLETGRITVGDFKTHLKKMAKDSRRSSGRKYSVKSEASGSSYMLRDTDSLFSWQVSESQTVSKRVVKSNLTSVLTESTL